MVEDFGDYHSDFWTIESKTRKWTVTECKTSKLRPFLRIVLKMSSFCKTHDFRDWGKSLVSRQIHPPKHFKPKVLKKFLSDFRDWKSYSRRSHELSRENLCVPLTTKPSTREQVAKIDRRARDCGMRLVLPATESPKHDNTVFWNFLFLKNKILSKNT